MHSLRDVEKHLLVLGVAKHSIGSTRVRPPVLDVDYIFIATLPPMAQPLKHSEFEMENTLLPRVNQLWSKQVKQEEMIGNLAGVRQIFERWIRWNPDDAQGWLSYIKFELRHNEVNRARSIYERFVLSHPRPSSFIKYAKFEAKHGEIARARAVYERAGHLNLSEDYEEAEQLFLSFATFEIRCNETERARFIFRYALDHLPKKKAQDLFNVFVAFEKQYGEAHHIDDAITRKMRLKYEDEVRKNPFDYDSWFDYIRLEENGGDKDLVREVYERAIANLPRTEKKPYWQRYIYIWINYALYEELDAQDMDRTREVYRVCLKIIPHTKFSFAKIWLMAAQFEIRQKNLKAARQILGNAIGMAPKDKIFKNYIAIELQLGNVTRCRILYEKYLEWAPANCYTWCKYAEFERTLNETERARALFELAVTQPAMGMPELLWKTYIDFEKAEGEFDRTRQLYNRLLELTKHLKVWISFAKFEAYASIEEEAAMDINEDQKREKINRCRGVFERALDYFRTNAPESKKERTMLLEEWMNLEISFGNLGDISLVQRE